jgi:hypothetical protein
LGWQTAVRLACKKAAADQKQTFQDHGAEICNQIVLRVVLLG